MRCCSRAPCLRPWAAAVSAQRPHGMSPLLLVDSRPTGCPGPSGMRSACIVNRRRRAPPRRADSLRTPPHRADSTRWPFWHGDGRASTPDRPGRRAARRTYPCAHTIGHDDRFVVAARWRAHGASRGADPDLRGESPVMARPLRPVPFLPPGPVVSSRIFTSKLARPDASRLHPRRRLSPAHRNDDGSGRRGHAPDGCQPRDAAGPRAAHVQDARH